MENFEKLFSCRSLQIDVPVMVIHLVKLERERTRTDSTTTVTRPAHAQRRVNETIRVETRCLLDPVEYRRSIPRIIVKAI